MSELKQRLIARAAYSRLSFDEAVDEWRKRVCELVLVDVKGQEVLFV